MKLEHLLQAYKVNNIEVELKEMNSNNERAGVINFASGISASYLLDDEDIVIAIKMFFNCLTTDTLTITKQINHVIKVIQIMQDTIMLLGNVTQKEANIIMGSLRLFDNTFQKRKANKTFRTQLSNRSYKWIIVFKHKRSRGETKMEIDDLVLREKANKYEETKRRITSISNKYRMISDKEIIEYLAEEIEQYRNRIKHLTETIENKEKEIEATNLETDESIDEDIIEIVSTTQYANGKPIISKIEYKYKENNKHELNTCPQIEIGYTKAY